MSRDGNAPELERSSSFARDFFQAGQGNDSRPYGAGSSGESSAMPPDAVVPGPEAGGMRRQRSRRRLSRGSRGEGDSADHGLMNAAAAAAEATVNFEEGEPTQNLPHMGDSSGKVHRQSSWYTDALLQGGTEDLSAILGEVQNAAASIEDSRADDDEVLEQYRIMAHVEANIRVKDNTGFDMAEYEKRRKLQPEPTKGDYYSGSKKPKARLPEPRLVGGAGGCLQKPEEPPLPPPRANRRFVEQRTPRVPELSPGVVVRGQGHVPEGEHVVRCLGCKSQLRVNMLATLVNCPDCSTVSPASSTRH